jgi:hypothetical protein
LIFEEFFRLQLEFSFLQLQSEFQEGSQQAVQKIVILAAFLVLEDRRDPFCREATGTGLENYAHRPSEALNGLN